MRFHLSCLSGIIAILLSSPYALAMEIDEEEVDTNKISLHSLSLQSPILDVAEDKLQPTIGNLRGFQPWYETSVTREAWRNAQQILTDAAATVTTSDKIGFWLKMYMDAEPEYFHLYNNLLQTPAKTLRKLDANKLLNPLFKYAAAFEHLLDNIRTNYRKTGKDYSAIQRKVLPIVQPTFNQYLKAWEELTSQQTSSLGSLEYEKPFVMRKAHLFYKRDTHGFLVFTIRTENNEVIDTNLFETYIPYKNEGKDFFEHSILFTVIGEKPVIQRREGLIFRDTASILAQDLEGVSITPYYGEYAHDPFTTKQTMSLIREEDLPTFIEDKKEPTTNYTSAVKQDTVDLPQSQRLQSSLSPEAPLSFYAFSKGLLANKSSTFLPYLAGPIEELEAEYLFLHDVISRVQLSQEYLSPDNILLLEYLKAGFPDQDPEQVLENYEKVLLEAYEDEETRTYKEQVTKEQEERSQRVAKIVVSSQRKKQKNNKKSITQYQKPIKSEEQLSLQDEEGVVKEAKQKAQARLNELKQHVKTKTAPQKFRKFLQAVNVVTQELAKLHTPVRAELNKSSHGNISVEGAKPVTIVRPHGLHTTISKKNSKGILTGLLNSYFEKLSNKKD